MKKILLLLLLLPAFSFAQEKGVQFVHDLSWDQLKAKAKAEHKYIMVDCYTTWCYWCKFMDKNLYPNDTVGNAANASFISVRVQFDSSKADNEEVKRWYETAHEFAGKYKVRGYPTLLFFNENGEIVDQHVGASLETQEFLTVLDNAKDPSKQYFVLKAKFDKGSKDTAFLRNFAMIAAGAYDMQTAVKAANKYIALQKNVYTKNNLTFIKQFTRSTKDTGYKIFSQHPGKVDALLGEDAAGSTIRSILFSEVVTPKIFPGNDQAIKNLEDYPKPDWAALHTTLKAKYPAGADELLAYSKVMFYKTVQNWDNFAPAVTDYMKQYGSKATDYQLNDFAWTVFEYCPDMTCVTNALDWSKKSFENNNNPSYIDTYANILYKMGRKDEAIAWEHKAMETAATEQKETFKQSIDKMTKGEKTWN